MFKSLIVIAGIWKLEDKDLSTWSSNISCSLLNWDDKSCEEEEEEGEEEDDDDGIIAPLLLNLFNRNFNGATIAYNFVNLFSCYLLVNDTSFYGQKLLIF